MHREREAMEHRVDRIASMSFVKSEQLFCPERPAAERKFAGRIVKKGQYGKSWNVTRLLSDCNPGMKEAILFLFLLVVPKRSETMDTRSVYINDVLSYRRYGRIPAIVCCTAEPTHVARRYGADHFQKIPSCIASQRTDFPCALARGRRLSRAQARRSLARGLLGYVFRSSAR